MEILVISAWCSWLYYVISISLIPLRGHSGSHSACFSLFPHLMPYLQLCTLCSSCWENHAYIFWQTNHGEASAASSMSLWLFPLMIFRRWPRARMAKRYWWNILWLSYEYLPQPRNLQAWASLTSDQPQGKEYQCYTLVSGHASIWRVRLHTMLDSRQTPHVLGC